MKKHAPLLLIFSIGCVSSMVGYGTWIAGYKYSYTATNKVQSVPVAYIIGHEDIKYTSIEKALEVAEKGDIVCVIPPQLANYNDKTNAVNPDSVTYRITRNCVIKEGVTLFIPTDKESEASVTDSTTLNNYIDYLKKPKRDQGDKGYNAYAENNKARFLRITIEIEAGKSLTNNGTLLISGFLGGGTSGGGCVGQTSHSYSRIVLNEGSSIIQNNANANTYCFGFIEEKDLNNNSFFDLQKGKLFIPCVINDYRGFTYSFAMTGGAINNDRCSVFNEIEFRNIKPLTKINYNSSVYGIINIYVKYDTLSVDDTMTIEKAIVGTTKDFLLQQTDSNYSHISYKYNPSISSFKAKCYGGLIFNYLSIDLSLKGQSLNLSTQNAYFPLSYKFDVELLCAENQQNATFNISNQRMKIMTGGRVYIGDNVDLVGDELIVYSAYYDGSDGNGQGIPSSGRSTYPLKENGILQLADSAKIRMNRLAGNVFCNNPTNITATYNTITSKEPWNLGSSGTLNPPWTIKNFLELNEMLSIVSFDFLNKRKICVGVNIFSSTNAFKPSFDVDIDNGKNVTNINGFQKIIFEEEINEFSFNFLSNIYKVFYNKTFYELNSKVTYDEKNKLVCVVGSDRQISSNNAGVNEFEVQKIEITGATHDVPKDTVLQLEGNIIDIDKAYNKKFEWSSLDPSICTVNQNGLVTGVNIGKTSIKLSSGAKETLYEINVVAGTDIEAVKSVDITESKGVLSGETFKDGTYTFEAKMIGENGNILTLADVSSVTWILTPEALDRGYFNNDPNSHELENTLKVNVKLNGGANANSQLGASPDNVYLTCKVIDIKGNEVSSKFHLVNDNGCLLEGTEILLFNGTTKKVEDLVVGDIVKVFNHETGLIDNSPIIFITHKDENTAFCYVITLKFENNIELNIVKDHALFDKTTNRYEILNKDNCNNFINHDFIFLDNGIIKTTKLKSFNIFSKTVKFYCPVTAFHLNLFANKLLTMPTFPYDIKGLYNIFELDEDMKYSLDKKKEDIDRFGIYSYEEFIKLINIPKEAYDISPAIYLKVSLGKGLITKEQIVLGINYLLKRKLI